MSYETLQAERDELRALLQTVVNGVELVNSGPTETLIETRVPKGTFAKIVKAAQG